jgi:hypothetical protein
MSPQQNKLEIKHIAPFLPYGLNCYAMGEMVDGTEYDDEPIPKLFELNGILKTGISIRYKKELELIDIIDFIPILHPLSDLTKDKKFIQLINEELICGAWKFEQDDWTTSIKTSNNKSELLVVQGEIAAECDFIFYQFMIEHHYDVFGLIDQGLAGDINKIKNA